MTVKQDLQTPRDPGYYWIQGSDEEPEVARWDADSEVWQVIGLIDALDEEEVTVLSESAVTYKSKP